MKLLTVVDIFDCRFELFVPKLRGRDKALEETLALRAGGYTIQEGIGAWKDGSDKVYIYQVQCHRGRMLPIKEALEAAARRLLDAGEEAVLLTQDGRGVLYAYNNPFQSTP